jgi:pSer/pThr/pTyr-binding forkhead associated (FHA) protein
MGNAVYVLVAGGRRLELKRTMVVGRSTECDVVLYADQETSRKHARFLVTPEGVYVEDLESTNGTYVGSEPVSGKRLITDRDVVRVGATLFRVERLTVSSSAAFGRWEETTPALGMRRESAVAEATRPADIFDVLERVAMNAVQSADLDEAERVTAVHLQKLLLEARKGTHNSVHLVRAIRIATELARGSRSARWLNYLIELHDVLRMPMAKELVDLLYETAGSRRDFDRAALERYCGHLNLWLGTFEVQEQESTRRVQSLLPLLNTA